MVVVNCLLKVAPVDVHPGLLGELDCSEEDRLFVAHYCRLVHLRSIFVEVEYVDVRVGLHPLVAKLPDSIDVVAFFTDEHPGKVEG